MRWLRTNHKVRATYGEAVLAAVALCALVVLFMANRAGAQEPVRLPSQMVNASATRFSEGQEVKVKGLIVGRDGDDMMVRDEDGHFDVITLTNDTKITSPSGLFKMERKERDVTNLLPGLIVEVKGNGGTRGNLIADKVTFHSSALRVAEQVAAGTLALSNRVDANKDSIQVLKARIADSLAMITARARDSLAAVNARFDDIDRYDVKDSATVNFNTGSAELSDEAKLALDAVVASGTQLTGYLVEITGYADAVGNSEMNQSLSDRRADAVVAYLTQVKDVPLRRIMNPTGFGETHPTASNDTVQGRALNRRAEVRVLVNRVSR
ncbi:MAG TPA: OmpA family protein [Gemmatimonadaceae bacterium]